jgi:MoaA/NifB/PqqE/SkfB family radical SAM enzyme
MKPADYRHYAEVLRPCVVQVSGGEPLMRGDIVDVVRNIKPNGAPPYTILVSNWSEMTEQLYLELRAAGIDQFSVSLDFPDDRHDAFRGYPGLFSHLQHIVPRLAAFDHDDIVLNSCITSDNLPEINAMADQARAWGVNIC